MVDVRCVKCKRLLMKAIIFHGEIKCPKCGYMNNISKSEPCNSEWEKIEKEIYSE